MSVQRWSPYDEGGPVPDDNGEFVLWSDFADLEARLAEATAYPPGKYISDCLLMGAARIKKLEEQLAEAEHAREAALAAAALLRSEVNDLRAFAARKLDERGGDWAMRPKEQKSED